MNLFKIMLLTNVVISMLMLVNSHKWYPQGKSNQLSASNQWDTHTDNPSLPLRHPPHLHSSSRHSLSPRLRFYSHGNLHQTSKYDWLRNKKYKMKIGKNGRNDEGRRMKKMRMHRRFNTVGTFDLTDKEDNMKHKTDKQLITRNNKRLARTKHNYRVIKTNNNNNNNIIFNNKYIKKINKTFDKKKKSRSAFEEKKIENNSYNYFDKKKNNFENTKKINKKIEFIKNNNKNKNNGSNKIERERKEKEEGRKRQSSHFSKQSKGLNRLIKQKEKLNKRIERHQQKLNKRIEKQRKKHLKERKQRDDLVLTNHVLGHNYIEKKFANHKNETEKKMKKKTKKLKKNNQPNIIFILTDDQDTQLGSMAHMPLLHKFLKEKGTTFENAFASTPMCCPSRSSILTGMYVHNHNTYTNNDNCSSDAWKELYEPLNFGTYLKNSGYLTGYFGKYLNGYQGDYMPPGWTYWMGLIRNSRYYNYSLNHNGRIERHFDNYQQDYLTDVITNQSIKFFEKSKKSQSEKGVLLVLSMPAPHGPEDAAPLYKELFLNNTEHHTPSWNMAPNPDKQWLLQFLPKMSSLHQKFTDLLQTKRLQTLQSVDVAVMKIYKMLERTKQLDNTYIIYTSDHGYHLGQYGVVKGKALPYETDVKIPFVISGPRVAANSTCSEIVLNLDLAPTLLDMAGVAPPLRMDGLSILPVIERHYDQHANKMNSNVSIGNADARVTDKETMKPKKSEEKQKKSFQWRDSFLIERGKLTKRKLEMFDSMEARYYKLMRKEIRDRKEKTDRTKIKLMTSLVKIVGQKWKSMSKKEKKEKLTEECKKKELKKPCSPNQELFCSENSDGAIKITYCPSFSSSHSSSSTPSSSSSSSSSLLSSSISSSSLLYLSSNKCLCKKPVIKMRKKRSGDIGDDGRDGDNGNINSDDIDKNKDENENKKKEKKEKPKQRKEKMEEDDERDGHQQHRLNIPCDQSNNNNEQTNNENNDNVKDNYENINGNKTGIDRKDNEKNSEKKVVCDEKEKRKNQLVNDANPHDYNMENLEEITHHMKEQPKKHKLENDFGNVHTINFTSSQSLSQQNKMAERKGEKVGRESDIEWEGGMKTTMSSSNYDSHQIDEEYVLSAEQEDGDDDDVVYAMVECDCEDEDVIIINRDPQFDEIRVVAKSPNSLPHHPPSHKSLPKNQPTHNSTIHGNYYHSNHIPDLKLWKRRNEKREMKRLRSRMEKNIRKAMTGRRKDRPMRHKTPHKFPARNDPKCNMAGMECFRMDRHHWKVEPFWDDDPICSCINSNNNTYWCLRTINSTHNFLFCEFITGFISYYDLNLDPHQLINRIHHLDLDSIHHMHKRLKGLKRCRGAQECNYHHGEEEDDDNDEEEEEEEVEEEEEKKVVDVDVDNESDEYD